MNRRETLLSLISLAVTPLVAQAKQRRTVPLIGVLWHAASAQEEGKLFAALQKGFQDLGYVAGQTIRFEHRFPAEHYERFNSLAAELVRLKVDVLVAVTRPAAVAAKRATATIPVVFILVPDPVESRLVDSLAKPGGNVTGFTNISTDLNAKRLENFKQAIVGLSRVALLVNVSDAEVAGRTIEGVQSAATRFGLAIQPVEVRAPDDLDEAFSTIAKSHADGVMVAPDGMLYNERRTIARLALAHHLPTIHPSADTVEAGLLMSYGPDLEAICRRAPTYVDKILKGAKPADLPVEQPTKFLLVINMKTAKALGLTIPQSLLLQADQVIQ
jgi:putative ABC transport system substrate-binding protein